MSKADDAKQEFNNPIGAWHDFTQFEWHHPQVYWKQSFKKASNNDHCLSPQPLLGLLIKSREKVVPLSLSENFIWWPRD